MARGRFLSKAIADDLRLADISLKSYALFLSAIPHLDVEGRLKGHPRQVKRIVMGMRRDFNEANIEISLTELSDVGLVVWYEVENDQYLFFPDFKENQLGLRPEREAESVLPPPTPDHLRSIPEQLRTNRVKVKIKSKDQE